MAILAQQYPVFQPSMRIIASITNAYNAVITTTFDHNYVSGEIVRIIVPPHFGMQQIDKQKGPITVLSSTTFSIPIDTRLYDVFSVPSTSPANKQYAQVVSIGEITEQIYAALENVLPYRAS
jgi:hypothetical protein